MEKAWPPLKECVQFKISLMYGALRKYPWEDDKYAFDFNSYYPPIPEQIASLRKLLDALHKNEFRPTFPEDIRNCPFCHLHPDPPSVDIPTVLGCYYDMIPLGVDILKDPVWDMDPIPCPLHLFEHVWPRIGGGAPGLVTPTQLEDTKKYLNQVRNSRGYDVDCVPNGRLVIPEFWDFELNDEVGIRFKDRMMGTLDAPAIVHINHKSEKVYELEDILKIVWTGSFLFLITFTAKAENSAACDTFLAIIDQYHPSNEALRECLLKPDCNAPGPVDDYPDFIIHPIQVPDFSMKRRLGKQPGEQYPTRPQTMTPMTPHKSQAGDPSMLPLQPVEAEPLQTLPPVVEENRD